MDSRGGQSLNTLCRNLSIRSSGWRTGAGGGGGSVCVVGFLDEGTALGRDRPAVLRSLADQGLPKRCGGGGNGRSKLDHECGDDVCGPVRRDPDRARGLARTDSEGARIPDRGARDCGDALGRLVRAGARAESNNRVRHPGRGRRGFGPPRHGRANRVDLGGRRLINQQLVPLIVRMVRPRVRHGGPGLADVAGAFAREHGRLESVPHADPCDLAGDGEARRPRCIAAVDEDPLSGARSSERIGPEGSLLGLALLDASGRTADPAVLPPRWRWLRVSLSATSPVSLYSGNVLSMACYGDDDSTQL